MAVPKFYEFHKPILQFLKNGNRHSKKELCSKMITIFNLTDEDINQTVSSGQKLYINRIGWALLYLKKAKLIKAESRGVFSITSVGTEYLKTAPDIITPECLKQFKPFADFINTPVQSQKNPSKNTKDYDVLSADSPTDAMDKAYSEIERDLEDDLLKEVFDLSDTAFEKLVIDLLLKMGYGGFEDAGHTTSKTNDEGIDGILYEDKLGFNRIFIQAKRWDSNTSVGRPIIQSFVGAIAGRDGKGLFVTTATFSQPAKEYSKTQHIVLIDGKMLVKLMIEHDFCVTTKHTYEIKSIDEDCLSDYQDE